jgi:hypothetical protein
MDPADKRVAARVEAMQRELSSVIRSDEKLNQEYRVDPEDLMRVDPEDLKPVRQREKRRGSRGFVRFLAAICLGVAGTLAWQSYGGATKQIIATRAPALGWSPESKQMIASSIQWLGWANPADHEDRESVPQKTSTAASFDPTQMQQIAQNLVALREMVQQLTAGQDQTTREVAKLESAVVEILMKMEQQPPTPAAPARKPTPEPPPPSRPAITPKQ